MKRKSKKLSLKFRPRSEFDDASNDEYIKKPKIRKKTGKRRNSDWRDLFKEEKDILLNDE